jgi:hypothetical protein
LRRHIKNHPDLPNIDDYIQIRREFIYILEPDLFISKEEYNKKQALRKCVNIIKIIICFIVAFISILLMQNSTVILQVYKKSLQCQD